MSAPKEIIELVERCERQFDACKSPQYNEAQLRQEFLNPFFKALGWDMDNLQGYAQIDRLAYDLYGLTEDEVRMVEGGGK